VRGEPSQIIFRSKYLKHHRILEPVIEGIGLGVTLRRRIIELSTVHARTAVLQGVGVRRSVLVSHYCCGMGRLTP
jgi:hypothetical protein